MLKKNSYKIEKEKYQMIMERGLDHVFTKVQHFDDENYIIVMEAGNCDLRKFCEIR